MECNKDEATRAKTIAEEKLEKKDYVGAKKFASKAQTLYPGLDGISQMLTTLDVYLSADNKIFGEIDWYSVLGVNPTADDDSVKRQYKKLALMLHPDKNRSIGADGAFQLISEAFKLLSDNAKRLEYNKRRGYNALQQNARTKTGGPSAPPKPPSQQKVPTDTRAPRPSRAPAPPKPPSQQKGPKAQSRSAKRPSKATAAASSEERSDTFWTTCYQCSTQYEYHKMYLNCPLLCRQCQKPFMASETEPPAKFLKAAKLYRRRTSVNKVTGGKSQQGPVSGTADAASKVNDEMQKRAPVESSGWEGFLKKNKLGNDKEKCKSKESGEENNSCADNVKEEAPVFP